MEQNRKRLTYGNVMSTIFIFLLLAGGTAVAAKQLGKKTVGPKQLKTNAVTTPKIKKGAVTKVKIADGAIDGTKIADGSVGAADLADGAVTAAKIATAATPFSQRVARFQKSELVPLTGGAPYPLGTVTQNAGEDHQFFAAAEFEFAAGCTQPRQGAAYLLIDAANPMGPLPWEIAGIVQVQDTGAGTVRRRADFTSFGGLGNGTYRTAPSTTTTHKFDLFLLSGSCAAGSGVSLAGVTVDVIGTK